MKKERIRFAIVGTGRISDWILKGALEDERFLATAVCSRSVEAARGFIAKHSEAFSADAKVFNSIEEVAMDKDIDAVYIGTPNSTHIAFALPCLKAGKHVLCEKPIATSEAELQQMIEAAKESGAVLMEAMISTLNPNFLKAKEMIKEIGPVRHFRASFCQYSSKYEALKRGDVSNSFDPRMGGGALADVGIYVTYPLVTLFGEPEEVSSHILTFPTESGPTDIHGNISVRYKEMTADLVYSKAVDSLSPTEICGEKGNIFIDAIHIAREVSLAPHAAPTSGRGEGAKIRTVAKGLDHDEYYYEFKEFIDTVLSGRKESSTNSLSNSLLNRRLMDKIKITSR